jgi:hypothetical protein
MKDQWLITGPASLIERGNPLLQETPVELSNSYALSEAVVQMRQGFSTEDYSAGGLDGPIEWIGRHVTNEGSEEAWAASNNSGTAELARRSSNVWAAATFSDTVSAANLRYMNSVPQNGKLFLCYDSDVNRLHVWDGSAVRRVGLIAATAPTVAQMGVGALSFTRYYRQRNAVQSGGVTVRRSEPSSSVSITIVNRLGVTVTKGAASGDGETHWEVEAAAAAAGPWYRIATVAVGTTTYDDTSASISTDNLSPTIGLYIPPPSAKYIVSDGAVLLMAACWESSGTAGQTTPKQNRVWFTRPLGASDVSDDESIPDTDDQRNWIEVGDAGPVTGLYGPVNGEIYVFKAASIFKLVPTGDLTTPYARVLVSEVIGAVDQRLICSGDLAGLPAIYFCDQNSGYALTQGGIQSFTEGIARDLRQTYITASSSFLAFDPIQHIVYLQVNSSPTAATGSYRTFTFDSAKQQWSGFVLGGATSGWILGSSLLGVSTYLGGAGAAINNGAFLEDPDGGRRLYLVGQSDSTTGAMFKWTGRTALDGSSPYVTTVRYRKAFGAMTGRNVTTGAPTVWYRNPQGTTSGTMTLQLSLIKNDDAVRSQSKTLAATDDETGIAVKQVTFEGLACADVSTLDVRGYLSYSGTAFQSTAAPAIDAIAIPYTVGSPLTQ